MRIVRVIAHAFGPLRDATLDLAPGMTVVVGPNEAGKSSWHAAARMALTGVRRGRGRATVAEAAVEQRHRPWDQPDRWEVEARLELADGRTIDIRQDLAGKVACRAVDVSLGRDVSDEIMDGTPDASRWLGLDRESFGATACVSQAQITAVANPETAEMLQEHMQRAAATRGTDATAAEAIERLVAFRRDAVGIDRAGARGPLRAARQRLDQAERDLAEARRRHAEYLDRSANADAAGRREERARRYVAIAEAGAAQRRAVEARARLDRATELVERHPEAPPALTARDEVADTVASALDGWARRPAKVALPGRSAAELERELASLPAAPQGDTQPDEQVVAATRELDLAEAALVALGHAPPAVHPGRADEAALRGLAGRLRAAPPEQAAELEAQLAVVSATRAAAGPAALTMLAAMLSGVALIVALTLLFVTGAAMPGLLLMVLAAVPGAWSVSRVAQVARTQARVRKIEAALAPYRAAAAHAAAERRAAVAQAQAAGLPAVAEDLERLADEALVARHEQDRLVAWSARHAAASDRVAAAETALDGAVRQRGAPVADDPRASLGDYLAACRERDAAARAAARAESLRREIEARTAAEHSAAEAAHAAGAAEHALRQAAVRAGVLQQHDAAPDDLVQALAAWRERRREASQAAERAITEWQQLTTLLDGSTVEDLRTMADRLTAEAAARLADAADELPSESVTDEMLAGLRASASRAERDAAELAGALDVLAADLPDVAEAEEEHDAATGGLRQVEELAGVLDHSLRLLRTAEQRVHRDLAPILAASVRHWLPIVSRGAYVEASVDPADLAVAVKEAASGRWRQARLLSEGTREQIYLLLRFAMAQHLVRPGESAPLLLDEVTAQSDVDRRTELLEVLHELSAERQIVLFTHDAAVAEWGQSRLVRPRDEIVTLAPAGPSTDRGAPSEPLTALPVG